MQDDALFLDLFPKQSSLIQRLAGEAREAARQFMENPAGYLASAFKDHQAGNARHKDLLRFGMAIGLFVYATLFAVMLVAWTLHTRHPAGADTSGGLTVYHLLSLQPQEPAPAKIDKDASGGGGGGNHETTPASQGMPPPFSPVPPLIATTTRPTINPPLLPMPETLLGDPLQNVRRNEAVPTGLLNGVIGPPSDGPGSNRGIGTGDRGGVGPGNGPGEGPGNYGGRGDGNYDGPSGRQNVDAPPKVDTLPRALNEPRPNYTEEARAHKVQGIVRARILVGSDGLVKQVRVVRGLPDGLNEEAIRAAMQMRFRPAMKSGAAVAFWMALDVEFNLR